MISIFSVVVVIHIALCLSLMGLVLVQQGKGADAGAIMGGGADGLMGAGGAGNVISKTTTALAIGFMITSIILVKFYDRAVVAPRSTGEVSLSGSVMEVASEEAPVVAKEVMDDTEAQSDETSAANGDAVEAAEEQVAEEVKDLEESSAIVDQQSEEAESKSE